MAHGYGLTSLSPPSPSKARTLVAGPALKSSSRKTDAGGRGDEPLVGERVQSCPVRADGRASWPQGLEVGGRDRLGVAYGGSPWVEQTAADQERRYSTQVSSRILFWLSPQPPGSGAGRSRPSVGPKSPSIIPVPVSWSPQPGICWGRRQAQGRVAGEHSWRWAQGCAHSWGTLVPDLMLMWEWSW